MKINLNMNNVNITLESNDKNSLMNVLDMIMMSNSRPESSIDTNLREEMREYLAQAVPVQQPVRQFIPASEKQKSLLKNIPEYKGRDLNSVSKSEASNAIERWNKRKKLSL